MANIEPFKRGEPLDANFTARLNELRALCLAAQPMPGNGTMLDATPTGFSYSIGRGGAASLRPLEVLEANQSDAPTARVRVVNGGMQSGGAISFFADPGMDPLADGSAAKPFFYLPREGDPDLADGDWVYVHLSVSFDGVYWRCDAMETLAGTMPAADALNAYLALTPIGVSGDAATVPQPQQFVGNFGWARRGTETVFVDDFWLMTADGNVTWVLG